MRGVELETANAKDKSEVACGVVANVSSSSSFVLPFPGIESRSPDELDSTWA